MSAAILPAEHGVPSARAKDPRELAGGQRQGKSRLSVPLRVAIRSSAQEHMSAAGRRAATLLPPPTLQAAKLQV